MENDCRWWKSGTAGVVGIAVGTVLVHLATGWRYGFNRDELMALEDARHLAWGYVQYPPMTAFFGWLALKLFGTSLGGFRFFAAVAQAVALLLTGWMAKEMGGGKWAMMVAALAGVPFALGGGALMQYIAFDYVCWVLVAYAMVRVLRTDRASSERPFRSPPDDRVASRGVEPWTKGKRQEVGVPEQNAGTKGCVKGDGRWWILVGVGIGLGMMAKYTMGLLAAGVVAGTLLTGARRYLRSGWLWAGALVAVGIFVPNFLWEWKRNFISMEFLRFLHQRDVQEGATNGFLPGQLELMMFALPLMLAGLWSCFLGEGGRATPGFETRGYNAREADAPWRALGWMYVVPLVLLLLMRGRDYYLAPAYPMLYAAGAVWIEGKWRAASATVRGGGKMETSRGADGGQLTEKAKVNTRVPTKQRLAGGPGRWARRALVVGLLVDVLVGAAVALPIAPVNSAWWKAAAKVDIVFPEEIGWEEFVGSVAEVWRRLPPEERERAGILTGNYGEVGALNLYGGRYGLPRSISGVNSSWERGYGQPAPETVIVAGYSREFLEKHFASCAVGARTWNRYGVPNEETVMDPEIFVCRGLRESWEEFWKEARRFA